MASKPGKAETQAPPSQEPRDHQDRTNNPMLPGHKIGKLNIDTANVGFPMWDREVKK